MRTAEEQTMGMRGRNHHATTTHDYPGKLWKVGGC